jgi:pimeloyl-ACP methyl ester carboxylesterase
MHPLLKMCFLASAMTIIALHAQDAVPWHDPSKHSVQFVTVQAGVRLEVLDWGGSGRNVVLMAGSGNTAHVFDDFAPRLSEFCHVYGITRRGYGVSSHPGSGYSEQRLAADVLAVIDTLKLAKPVLMGHSMSGEELTRLGDEHSDRLAGLIYLDAASDPTDWPGNSAAYMALFHKLPEPMQTHPEPAAADMKSFHEYYEWQLRNRDTPFPESELRNQFEMNPDGSVGEFGTSDKIHRAIGKGALKRDYSKIHVPILAFFPVVDTESKYRPRNEEERAAIAAFNDATVVYVDRYKKNLQNAASVRIVDLQGANHYVFLSNPTDVLREVRVFLTNLR